MGYIQSLQQQISELTEKRDELEEIKHFLETESENAIMASAEMVRSLNIQYYS